MLNLLIDYAKKTPELTVEPGFKPKTIRWAIVCDANGRFLNVQELGNSDNKFNRGEPFPVCPDLSQPEIKAGGPGCRHYLVDTIEVVALMGKDGDLRSPASLDEEIKDALKGERRPNRIVEILTSKIEELEKDIQSQRKGSRQEHNIKEKLKRVQEFKKAHVKHQFFKSLLKRSSSKVKEAFSFAQLLDSEESLSKIQHAFEEKKFRPTDKVTFATIVGGRPKFLLKDDTWHKWWREFRHSLTEKKSAKQAKQRTHEPLTYRLMRCFASGEIVKPVLVHREIEGLYDVGGLAKGDILASFKQESFQSYFLTQAENSAVSEEMASAYRAALNDLIKNTSQRLAGAKLIHWYAGEKRVEKQEDPMGLLYNDPALSWLDETTDDKEKERDALHRARLFLDAIESGTKPNLMELKKYRYYAMILSANSGRVVTRNWIEGQFGELAKSIVAWFEHLEIVNVNGLHRAKSPEIEKVITCLLPPIKQGQKYKDWIKPIGDERVQLWRASISKNELLPSKVLSRLVPLHQAFMLSGDFADALDESSPNRARNLSLLYTRMALLKTYHIRKGDKNMQPYLNENHPALAYHCGRLMAILAEIQREALPTVGAGVIQRYYASASTTPALVFGRLVKNSIIYHLDKIEFRKKKDGLTDVLTGVWGRLKDEVPRVLDLEAQSLFALGFYQQLGKLASIDWSKYEIQFTTSKDKGEKS